MLEARGITYAYPGGARPLYQGFDLAVAPDERVALCAPSGFGKTTLCRLLAGYERSQAGEILVDDAPLPRRGACPVQMIWQHPEAAVDPRMRMGATLAEAGEVPLRLLDDLGIQKRWLTRYPHELSGGELQRFCVIRALSTQTRILICDEMTAMLDAVTQAQIWGLVLGLARERGMGAVVITHNRHLAERVCDRVVEADAAFSATC